MPKKGVKSKKESKKVSAKRNYARSYSLERWKGHSVEKLFPDIMPVTFTYSDTRLATVPTGSVTTARFRANSIYDPDISVGGNQPRYYDTLMGDNNTDAPYRRYSVLACRCVATVVNQSASHLYAAITMFSNQATAPSTLDEARERSDTIVRIVPPLGSGPAVAKLVMQREIGKLLGVKDMLDNPDMKSDFNSSPVAQANVTVSVFNPYSTATEPYALSTELQYDSRLFVKNDVLSS